MAIFDDLKDESLLDWDLDDFVQATEVIRDIANRLNLMVPPSKEAVSARMCFLCSVGRVFSVADLRNIFLGYRFAWPTEFLFGEENFRVLGIPCCVEAVSKMWFEVKAEIFELANAKIDVRRIARVGLSWFKPAKLDILFDAFREWVPCTTFDLGSFVKTYNSIDISPMNVSRRGDDESQILEQADPLAMQRRRKDCLVERSDPNPSGLTNRYGR
jgi:hypothetical protein